MARQTLRRRERSSTSNVAEGGWPAPNLIRMFPGVTPTQSTIQYLDRPKSSDIPSVDWPQMLELLEARQKDMSAEYFLLEEALDKTRHELAKMKDIRDRGAQTRRYP